MLGAIWGAIVFITSLLAFWALMSVQYHVYRMRKEQQELREDIRLGITAIIKALHDTK